MIDLAATPDLRERGVPVQERRLHELTSLLAPELVAVRPGYELVIASELTIRPRRPDLVFAEVDIQAWRSRAAAGVPACTAPSALRVLDHALRSKRVLPQSLLNRAEKSERKPIQSAIARLIGDGILVENGGEIVVNPVWELAVGTTVGIEAKLRDFRRAKSQIVSWRHNVNNAFLAFPSTYLQHVDRADRTIRTCGLIGVDVGAHAPAAHIVRKGRTLTPRGVARLLVSEELYARWQRTKIVSS